MSQAPDSRRIVLSRRLVLVVFSALLMASCGDDGVTVVRSEAPSLSGNVGQVATALLIAGVLVTADGAQVTTTPNGRYSFEDLEVGEVTLTAEFPGFETYTRRVRIREGRNTHDISMIPIP